MRDWKEEYVWQIAEDTLEIHEYSEGFELWTFLWNNDPIALTINTRETSIWSMNTTNEDLHDELLEFVEHLLAERDFDV